MFSFQAGTRLNQISKIRPWPFNTSRAHYHSHSQITTQSENQTITLPDGRVLGFAEYGHPDGTPLIWFHGYPASRLEAWGAHQIARRRRIRIIALDRPGFGLSTYQPGRRIVDWPADVRAFAEQTGLKRFAVLGGSGGGPYAVACAHLLPHDMMTAVGVLAGAPPWEAGVQNVSWSRRALSFAANYAPTLLRYVSDALVGVMRWIVTSRPVLRRLDGWLELQRQKKKETAKENASQKGDGKALEGEEEDTRTIAEQRDRLLHILFDGFAQGSRAAVQEARLLSEQSWGFKFEDVSYDPVMIWHGAKDTNTPLSMIQYMAKRLPHSTLREYEDDTHYTIGNHLDEILTELVPGEPATESRKRCRWIVIHNSARYILL